MTVSGGTVGVKCVFPFKYNGKEYQGCTVADVSDGKLWCSTSTDRNGNHIGGGGFWGHCPTRNCQTDQSIVQLSAKELQQVVLKSVNLQYITLVCLDDGPNKSSTKRLMF